MKELYSVNEFCQAFGVCRSTFYNEVRAGRIRTVKLGATLRVKRADAMAWLDSLPENQPAAAAA